MLGLKDYILKCGFNRVVVGLSGGIDSALVAWIATQAIGAENVLGVALPSKFNSQQSLTDALQLAKNLGIQFRIIPIHDLYDTYKKVLGYEETSRLSLTLQNLQARIRSNLLMALSNEEGRLLLTTGNKSELAMGYCTLYGDMAGGFAVIADVPKTLVYRVAREANQRHAAIPENVFRKAPSAELAFDQKDEDDLPPYKKLDPILNDFISKEVNIHLLAKQYPDGAMLEKILNRVDRNEYKRMQMPPGIRITTKAFGSGRRVPIAHRFVHRVR